MQMANDHRPGCPSSGKVRRIPSSRTILEAWGGKHQSTWNTWEKGCLAGTWGWIAMMWKERIIYKKWTWPLTPIWEPMRNKCYNGKNTYKVLYSSFLFYLSSYLFCFIFFQLFYFILFQLFYFIYPVIYFILYFSYLFQFVVVIIVVSRKKNGENMNVPEQGAEWKDHHMALQKNNLQLGKRMS